MVSVEESLASGAAQQPQPSAPGLNLQQHEEQQQHERGSEEGEPKTGYSSPGPDQPERHPVSRNRMYFMVMADFGLSFVWLCKYAVATPYFQHSLKAGPFLSHLVWIMGPLSGLIVAPIVGVLSDRCTSSFGRRRPFILGGALFCILGMNVFANASAITFGFLPAARVVAVLAFGVLDFATNAIMFPSRALFGDLLPADQQHPVQSAAAVVASMAEICGGIYLSSWKDPVTNISRIFAVASVLLIATCSISLMVCKETPIEVANHVVAEASSLHDIEEGRIDTSAALVEESTRASNTRNEYDSNEDSDIRIAEHEERRGDTKTQGVASDAPEEHEHFEDAGESMLSEENSQRNQRNVVNDDLQSRELPKQSSFWPTLRSTIAATVRQFPRPLIKVGIVYGLAWFMWFASLPYYSQWLGVDVLQGDPNAEPSSPAALRYEHGVSVFSIANVAKAVLAIFFSFFYPSIISFIGAVGERLVFGIAFLVFSSVLFSCAFTKDVLIAGLVIALGSVPFIVTQTIPIAIAVQRYPENLASNLGMLNLFCVVPQLIDTLYTGKVAEVAGESMVLRVASCWGFAAAIAAFCFL
ncbi:MFS transporter [Gracilaria domingensis]|nr:MFS transporter [Gracilaria domingensis]